MLNQVSQTIRRRPQFETALIDYDVRNGSNLTACKIEVANLSNSNITNLNITWMKE